MDRTRQLVGEYARANGYEVTVDFRQKKRMFSKDVITIREDEIVGSPGFAGFCDGYQNMPHRYKGPRGSPEKSAPVDFVSVIGKAISLSVPKDVAEDVGSIMESLMAPGDYDEQYRLGRSCSSK